METNEPLTLFLKLLQPERLAAGCRRRGEHHYFPALAAGEIEEDGLAKWFGRHLKKTQ